MEGYSVPEAATILGVPTERVWELLARGVLAGTSEGEAGMRVYLQPRPAPAPAPISPGPGWPNGNDEPGEPGRELSPFRELLTEFRNLTERYGQALLALGEARGEVATLRSRVDLLEARMDLRLPMAGFTLPASSASSPWPSASVTRAVSSPSEVAPDEHGAEEAEDELDRPARRRRSSQRRATESFAEALARAEDPTRSELPGASDVATALAALRDESGHAAGAPATEAVLPRELPAADVMPFADEGPEAAVVAAEPEPVRVAPDEPRPGPEVTAAEPEPMAAAPDEPDEAETEQEVVAAEPEPVAVEQLEPEPEIIGAAPYPVAVAADEPQPEREVVDEPAPESMAAEPPWPAAEPDDVAEAAVVSEPEPVIVVPEPEPVAVVQADAASADDAAEPEPVAAAADEREPEPEVVEEREPPAAEAPEHEAEVETAVGAAEQAPEADNVDIEAEMESPPVGEELKAEEVAEDLEAAADQPDAVEPTSWDRDRYTVDIVEPDWFAGEEPGNRPATEQVPGAGEDVPDAEVADAPAALREAGPPVPEAAPAPSAAHRDEETMLWFGHQPSAPTAELAEGHATIDEGADDGSNEMEVAGSGHRAQMPGSQELDEALAALNALGRDRAEAVPTDAAEGQVEERAAETWPRADSSAWTPPRAASAHQAPATPASRAYRRLRRIFPG